MARVSGHMLNTEALVRSEKWRSANLDDSARLVYCLLIGAVDSWGMIPADVFTMKGKLAPMTGHSTKLLESSIKLLESSGLLRTWLHQGAPWLIITDFDKHQRLDRRKKSPDVPIPDFSSTTPEQSGALRTTPLEVEVEVEGEGEGDCFRTAPPPKSDLPPPIIVTEEEQQTIHSLRDYHAGLHKLTPRGFIEGDDLQRIALVLREYGDDGCRRIIKGHRKRCEDGCEKRTSFASAFPHIRGDPKTPNWDWISQHSGDAKTEKKIRYKPGMEP